MLAAALVLVVGAVLLWPTRGVVRQGDPEPAAGEVARTADDTSSRAPTLDEAADALVLCALALRSGLGPVESLEAVAARVPPPVARDLRIVASAHR